MPFFTYLPYLVVMTLATYLIRVLPLWLVRRKIENRFIRSFLYYTPYAVLSAMTFPAILYATNGIWSALVGFIAALLLAFFERSLLTVAGGACAAALITELVQKLI